MWFDKLFGFDELNPEKVRKNLEINNDYLVSKINNKSYSIGQLEIPTLKNLSQKVDLGSYNLEIKVQELIGNTQEFHRNPLNKNALFQAASQFNLLEMTGPTVTPEQGIGIYEYDLTQGPACAISCGAGTVYRNYFVEVNKQIGQTKENQIDCLEEIGVALGNKQSKLWEMKNGYALPSLDGIETINKTIESLDYNEREELKQKLKIGIQWNTQVTLNNCNHLVNQAYCSALPISYSNIPNYLWENFARLILEALYEATLFAGLINFEKTNCNKVFLTLVGGGAFGNQKEWIFDGLFNAILKFKNTPLDVSIVSFGRTNKELTERINNLTKYI